MSEMFVCGAAGRATASVATPRDEADGCGPVTASEPEPDPPTALENALANSGVAPTVALICCAEVKVMLKLAGRECAAACRARRAAADAKWAPRNIGQQREGGGREQVWMPDVAAPMK